MTDNPLLLMLLFLAIVVMAGYFYLQRAKGRDAAPAGDEDQHTPS